MAAVGIIGMKKDSHSFDLPLIALYLCGYAVFECTVLCLPYLAMTFLFC